MPGGFWRVLDRPGIRPEDDFFLLGGDSLSAVELIAGVASELQIDLPLEDLIRRSTPRELAAWLVRYTPGAPRDLVGVNTGGHERPLFGVCGRYGYALRLLLVGRQLGADQPFYALQPPGMDWEGAGCRTIPAMAAHYVTRVKTVQAEGPYRLLGTSFGGLVAFEMARQLQAAGERIELLVVVDTQPSGHHLGRRVEDPGGTLPVEPLDQARSAVEAAGIRVAAAHVRARLAYRIDAPIQGRIDYLYCAAEAIAIHRDPRRYAGFRLRLPWLGDEKPAPPGLRVLALRCDGIAGELPVVVT